MGGRFMMLALVPEDGQAYIRDAPKAQENNRAQKL